MKKILSPIIKVIKSNPSSLGDIDRYLVLFDSTDKVLINWLMNNEAEVAEELYETAEYKNVYVLHCTSSYGERIKPIDEEKTQTVSNRINCDSVISFHCLAIKIINEDVIIRTGFHETSDGTNSVILPFEWQYMYQVSNNFQEISMNKKHFFKLYKEAIKKWKVDYN